MPIWRSRSIISRRLAVERDDARAAETKIVLQGEERALDLPRVGGAAELVGQFIALRQPGRAERVALGEQPARRIGDVIAAIAAAAFADLAFRTALRPQAARLVGDPLGVGEEIVTISHLDKIGRAAWRNKDGQG